MIIWGSVAAMALAAIVFYAHLNEVLSFVCSGVAIALLAALVGRCVERLGDRLGAGATGVLQSALGNLPELFISFFALRAGLLTVVQSALIGSILANLLLVLGAAFLVGGLKHGTQRFDHGRARTTAVLLALATAALVLPSLAAQLHSPAGGHETELSVAVAIILLGIFALSLPASLRRAEPAMAARSPSTKNIRPPVRTGAVHRDRLWTDPADRIDRRSRRGHWPIWLATVMLALAGVAGLVSDWFVDALQPAIDALHISPAFAGLVIVAIAGNAVENVVGIQCRS